MSNLSRRNFMGLALSSLGMVLVPKMAMASGIAEKIPFTEEMALEAADRFAASVSDFGSLRAISARTFYDGDLRPLGYIVDYVDDGLNPHGYIVFDTTDESLIAEFSFDEGISGPFASDGAEVACSSTEEASLLVKTSPFTYALCGSDENVVDCYGQEMPNPLRGVSMPAGVGDSNWSDIFLGDAFNGSYEVKELSVTGKGFCSYEEEKVINCTGTYACAVVALMNCATPYCRNSWPLSYGTQWVANYHEMWRLAKTSVYNTGNGIRYGSVENGKIGPALVDFCANRGISLTYKTSSSPSFNQFKTTIERGDLSIFACGINVNADRDGHAMAVHGCAVIKPTSGNAQNLNVLLVADGWAKNENTNAKYLNLAFSRYTDTFGIFYD